MDILDLFYNRVLKEISTGRVDCNIMYNVLFETSIKGKNCIKQKKN